MDETLAEIVDRWSGRWRYPLLVTELARTQGAALNGRRVAELLLAGLADPVTEAEGIRQLIRDGEFTTVETLFEHEAGSAGEPWRGLAGEWSREIPGLLADARRTARSTIAREAAILRERAERIGCVPGDLSEIEGAAEQRLADARMILDAEEQRIQGEETTVAEELRGRLRGPKDPRASAVEACLAVGEFPTARWLLETDGYTPGQGGPHTVRRAPRWPWYGHLASEVLGWYDDGAKLPFPQLARFVRARHDSDAAAVITRLRALTSQPDAITVGAFAAALGRVLGEDSQPSVEERSGGFATTLVGLDDTRLPRLSLLRKPGIPLWVSNADVPPPGDLAPPVVWFIPGNAEELAGPAGTAVLDIPGLLCLLAPLDDDLLPTVPDRRINLLRALTPQLNVSVLADAISGIELDDSHSRDSLAWLLDLLGVGADAVVLDTLDYEAGRHPLAVPAIIASLLKALRDRGAYHLTIADLEAIRAPETRNWLRTLLFDPLDAAERALLGLAGALFPSEDFDATELMACAHLLGLPEDVAPEQLLRPVPTAEALVTARLLDRHGDDRYRLSRSGVGDLAQGGGGWDPAAFAAEALEELLRNLGDAQTTISA